MYFLEGGNIDDEMIVMHRRVEHRSENEEVRAC